MPEDYLKSSQKLLANGQYKKALTAFEFVLLIKPNSVEAFRGAAQCLAKLNCWEKAIINALNALSHGRNQVIDLSLLIDIVEESRLQLFVEVLIQPLKTAYKQPTLTSRVYPLLIVQLEGKYNDIFSQKQCKPVFNDVFDQLIKDPLFHMIIEQHLVANYFIEDIILLARATIINKLSQGESITPYLPFLASLACLTLLNDGLYGPTDSEAEKLGILNLSLADFIDEENKRSIEELVLTLCYIQFADALRIGYVNKDLIKFSDLENLNLALAFYSEVMTQIDEEGVIKRDTSRLVQSFYAENPYPKWHVMNTEALNAQECLHSIGKSVNSTSKILIAGCGTGKQAIEFAKGCPELNVTAIDISHVSLSYARLMANKYNVTNIEFILLDILDIAVLNLQFDYIVCTGVLHHMASPQHGLNALESVLTADGYMLIALYSRLARQELAGIKSDLISFLHTEETSLAETKVTKEGVIKWRGQLSDKSKQQPWFQCWDFFGLSGIYDLILHPQQFEFDLLEIKSLLQSSGLKFKSMGVSLTNNQPLKKLIVENPVGPEGETLEYWHSIENKLTNTFTAMYQFYVTR